MSMRDELTLQQVSQEDKGTETKAISTLAREGEIRCIVVYPDKKHVEYIDRIIDPLREEKQFKLVFLSENIKPLEHYGKEFKQLAEECALGIVILDGLRPNVLLELGILIGKNKPVIPIQDINATVAIRSFYSQEWIDANLTSEMIRHLKNLPNPPLGFFNHISDLKGRHLVKVDINASKDDPKSPEKAIHKAINNMWTEIIEAHNKSTLEQIKKIAPNYLQRFSQLLLKISDYYGGRKEFSAEHIEDAIKEIRELEKSLGTPMPFNVYEMISSLYVSLAEKTEWKDIHKIMDYYNRSIKINERILELLELEPDPVLKSQTQKKIADIYWKLSQYE